MMRKGLKGRNLRKMYELKILFVMKNGNLKKEN